MTDPISLMIRKPPRVWSLIVTLFGDLAPDQPVSGAALGAIMARAGVKPEATRVALHRLRKEDWIVSEREGRSSRYHLSDSGQRATRAATPRIYDFAPVGMDDLSLWVLAPDAPAPPEAEVLSLGGNVVLGRGEPPKHAIVQDGGTWRMPRWARLRMCPRELSRGYGDLEAVLTSLRGTHLPQDPMEQAVLRILIVHAWRRLVLRHAPIPDAFWPEEARAVNCRKAVRDLLGALPRHDPETLR